jgi:hypothetical protein
MKTIEFTYSFEHPRDLVSFSLAVPFTSDSLEKGLTSLVSKGPCVARPLHFGLSAKPTRVLVLGSNIDKLWKVKKKKVLFLVSGEEPKDSSAGNVLFGFLSRFQSADKQSSQLLRAGLVIVAFPTLNPDGCALGNSFASPADPHPSLSWSNPQREIKAAKRLMKKLEEHNEILGVIRFKGALNQRGVGVSKEVNEASLPQESEADKAEEFRRQVLILSEFCQFMHPSYAK